MMPEKRCPGNTSDFGKSPKSDGGRLKNGSNKPSTSADSSDLSDRGRPKKGESSTKPLSKSASSSEPVVRRLSVKLEKLKMKPEFLPVGGIGKSEPIEKDGSGKSEHITKDGSGQSEPIEKDGSGKSEAKEKDGSGKSVATTKDGSGKSEAIAKDGSGKSEAIAKDGSWKSEAIARSVVVVQASDDETVDQIEENQVRMLRFVDSSGDNVTDKVLAEAREASQERQNGDNIKTEPFMIEDKVKGDAAQAIERKQFKEDFNFESELDEEDSEEDKNIDNLKNENDANKEDLKYPNNFNKENIVKGLPLLNLKRVPYLHTDQAIHLSSSETELETIYVNAKSEVIDNESPVRLTRNVSSATTIELSSPTNEDDEKMSISASFVSDSSPSQSVPSAAASLLDKEESLTNSLDRLIPDRNVSDGPDSEDESDAPWCDPGSVSADDESDGSDNEAIQNFLVPGYSSPVKTPKKKSGEKRKRRKSNTERPKSGQKLVEKLTPRSSGRKKSSLVRAREAVETTGTDTDDVASNTPPRPRRNALKFDIYTEAEPRSSMKMDLDEDSKESKTNDDKNPIKTTLSFPNQAPFDISVHDATVVENPVNEKVIVTRKCDTESNLNMTADSDSKTRRSRSSNVSFDGKTLDQSLDKMRGVDSDRRSRRSSGLNGASTLDTSADQSIDSDRNSRRSSGVKGASNLDTSLDRSIDSDRRSRRSSGLKGSSNLDTTLDPSFESGSRIRRSSGFIKTSAEKDIKQASKLGQVLLEVTDLDTTDTEVKKETKLPNPKYKEGQILLVRVGKAPWWPAMVKKDPVEGELRRSSKKGAIWEHHVGFIGENTRSWVKETENYMMPFRNEDGLKSLQAELYKSGRKVNPDALAAFAPKAHQEVRWRASLKGGEKLNILDKKARFEQFESVNSHIEKNIAKRKKQQQELNKSKNENNKSKNIHVEKGVDSPLSPPVNSIKVEPEFRRSNATLRQKEVELRKEEEKKKKEEAGPGWEYVFAGYKAPAPPPPEQNLGRFTKGPCCIICEDARYLGPVYDPEDPKYEGPGYELMKCKGSCGNSWHRLCLKLGDDQVEDGTWKCSECVSGLHPCFICKKTDPDMETNKSIKRCNSSGCPKWYHEECLTGTVLWPQTRVDEIKGGFSCPAHMCHTCASENVQDPIMKYTERLMKCLRCPTSYHQGDFCGAAGTLQMTKTEILCPKHFEPAKTGKKKGQAAHVNIIWCHVCGKSGAQHGILYLCEICPGAVHRECTEQVIPEGDLPYYCDDCESGKRPLYGEVIWAKFGNFRWWPAQVLHPTKVPDNIEKRPHQEGEFAVKFLGSGDYEWIQHGRVTPFNDDEKDVTKCEELGKGKGMKASYNRGLIEAVQLCKEYNAQKEERESANMEQIKKKIQGSSKPPPYVKLKMNLVHKDCPVDLDNEDDSKCTCKADDENPCGKDDGKDGCLNRMVLQECDPTTCSAEKRCKNLRFQNREYQVVKVVRVADDRGFGLYADAPIKKGTFVIEYVGEVIGMDEYRRRMRINQETNEECYYYMTIDKERMIDAGPKGNVARFMNHSCDPNCDTKKWKVKGETRVGLFANTDIPPGDELTFNYCLEAVGDEKKKCLCGASNCSGFIGEKPISDKDRKKQEAQDKMNKEKMDKRAKKKHAKKSKAKNNAGPVAETAKFWEWQCYNCVLDESRFDIKCDFKDCPRVFHFECARRQTLPVYPNKWKCQWHSCNEPDCGKDLGSSDAYCGYCENSWCEEHKKDKLMPHALLGDICNWHQFEIESLTNTYKTHLSTPFPSPQELSTYISAYRSHPANKRVEPYPNEDSSDESKVEDSGDESTASKKKIYKQNSLTEDSSCTGSSRGTSREPSITRDGSRPKSPLETLVASTDTGKRKADILDTGHEQTKVSISAMNESEESPSLLILPGQDEHVQRIDGEKGEKSKNSVVKTYKNAEKSLNNILETAEEELDKKSQEGRHSLTIIPKKVQSIQKFTEQKNEKSKNSDKNEATVLSPERPRSVRMAKKKDAKATISDFVITIGKHRKCSNKNCGSSGSKGSQMHLKYRNLDNVEVGSGPQLGVNLAQICPELEMFQCRADKENCNKKFDRESYLLDHCRQEHPATGKVEGAGYKCVGANCEIVHRFVWGSDQFMQHWKSHRLAVKDMKYQDLETKTVMNLNDVYPYVGQCVRCLKNYFSNRSFEDMKELLVKHWISDHGLPENEFTFTTLANGKMNLEKEKFVHKSPKKEVFITPKRAVETALKKDASPLLCPQNRTPKKKVVDAIELNGPFLCKGINGDECEKECKDSGALLTHSSKVHGNQSLSDLYCEHLESGRCFLITALFKYVLECGLEGCFRFYCANKDLGICHSKLKNHWKSEHPSRRIQDFITKNIGTEHDWDATPIEDISSLEDLNDDLDEDLNATCEAPEYLYTVQCRICSHIRNSNVKFHKVRSAIGEHLRKMHGVTENFHQRYTTIHNADDGEVYKIPDDLVEFKTPQREVEYKVKPDRVEVDNKEIKIEDDVVDVRMYNKATFGCLIDSCGERVKTLSGYMSHFNEKHYNVKHPHGPQLDRIVVKRDPGSKSGCIMTIENCFQFLGKCKSESGCQMILGASGRLKDLSPTVSLQLRFGDGHYEMRRKFSRHYFEQHPNEEYDVINPESSFTFIMGEKSEGHKKLWTSNPKERLIIGDGSSTPKRNLKRKRSSDQKSSPGVQKHLKSSVNRQDTPQSSLKIEKDQLPFSFSRVRPNTILCCNYCSRELCGADSLDHWNQCQPTLDISNLIYTNTETCQNARARDIYGQIGRCTYEQCGHYIGSVNQLLLNKKILNTRFMSHYKKCHGLPEHFNTPQHYTIVNLSEESGSELVVAKKSSEKKRISNARVEKNTDGFLCLSCDDDNVTSTNVTRHFNSLHAGQDILKMQFKCLTTDRVIGIHEVLPEQIIGKCNACGQLNKVSKHLGMAVLKSVLRAHYRKSHGDPSDDCWKYLGGGPQINGNSSSLDSPSGQSPMAKKMKREHSFSGETIKRGRSISVETNKMERSLSVQNVQRGRSISGENIKKVRSISGEKIKRGRSVSGEIVPNKRPETTPLFSSDKQWICSLCDLSLSGSLLKHWRDKHPDLPEEAFRVFRSSDNSVSNLRGIYSHVYRCQQCSYISTANKQISDLKIQMRKHWKSKHSQMMTHEKDCHMEEVLTLGYHCQVEGCQTMLNSTEELQDHIQIHPEFVTNEMTVRNMDTDQILTFSEIFSNGLLLVNSASRAGMEEMPTIPIHHADTSISGLSCSYGLEDPDNAVKCSTIISHGNNGDALRHWQLKHRDKPLKDLLFIDTVTSAYIQFNDMLKLAVVCNAPDCTKVVYTNDEVSGEKKMCEHWAKDHPGEDPSHQTESLENYLEERPGVNVADETFVDFNNDTEGDVENAEEVYSVAGDDFDVEVETLESAQLTVVAYRCAYPSCPKTILVQKFQTTMGAQQKLKKHWLTMHKQESPQAFSYHTRYSSGIDGGTFEVPPKIDNILEEVPGPIGSFLEPVEVLQEPIGDFLEVVEEPENCYSEDVYHCTEIVKKGEQCKERFMDEGNLRIHWGTAHHVDGKTLEPFKTNIRQIDHYVCPRIECGFEELNVNAVKRHWLKEHSLDGKFQVMFVAAIPPAPVQEIEQLEPVSVVCLGVVEPCTEEEPLSKLRLRSEPEVRTCDFSGCTFTTYSIRDLEIHKRDMGHKKRELEVQAGNSGAYPYKVYQCKQFGCGYRIGGINLIEEHMMGAHPEVKPEDWNYEEFSDQTNNKRKRAAMAEDDLPEEKKKSEIIANYNWNLIIDGDSDSDSDLPDYSVL